MDDLTIIYYTANFISNHFQDATKKVLLEAIGQTFLISVSQKPMDFGENICVGEIGRSAFNIYRQALIGAKAAKTQYVAMAEDDILYSADHFTHRPHDGFFAYDKNNWSIYTWVNPPVFSYKDRRTFYSLICERDLLIETLEEREAKYPNDKDKPILIWGEPGRYEGKMGVSRRNFEIFYSKVPNVVFSHETALAFDNLGRRKKMGDLKAIEIPFWGRAEDILKLYDPESPFIYQWKCDGCGTKDEKNHKWDCEVFGK